MGSDAVTHWQDSEFEWASYMGISILKMAALRRQALFARPLHLT